MLVKGDRIVERVDAEAVLGEAGNIRTEEPAARGHNQPIVGELLSLSPDIEIPTSHALVSTVSALPCT